MELWVVYILFYGILKGIREPIKKTILRDTGVLSVLFGYTLIGFFMSVPTTKGVFSFSFPMFCWIVIKSLVIFVGWIFAFKGLKKIPVSIYGICDMSRVIFSTLLGVAFLNESLTVKGAISLVLVAFGLYFANQKKSIEKEEYKLKYVWYVLLSCLLNAISGILDKYIMSTGEITSSALQFWFMLLLSLFYLANILIKKEKIEFKKVFTNPWIYLLSFLLVFGDRLLFIANEVPTSKVTVMTILKQSAVLVTIFSGKIFYQEKNIMRKLLSVAIILIGIALSVF